MKHNILTAIDIGTTAVRVVVAQQRDGETLPYIVASAAVACGGMRRGGIVEPSEVATQVADALRQVEVQCGETIRSGVLSIGGTGIGTRMSRGVVVVGRTDGEITQEDIDRVLTAAQAISVPANKEIVHVLPRRYSVDDQTDIKDSLGMTGVRLEVEAFIVDAPLQNLRGVETVAQMADFAVEDIVVGALASADAVLDRQQKELGVVLIGIGASTTSVVVYEEGELIHATVLPIGAGHVTNDIAIGLRTAITTAEAVKLHYGVAIADAVDRREECDLAAIDPREEGTVSRHHLAEIIQARMEEIFALVQSELTGIGKAELLPAGAVLVGGGAKLPYVVRLAKNALRLPVRIGDPLRMPGMFDRVDDPIYATALGLIHWALRHENTNHSRGAALASKGARAITGPLRRISGAMSKFFERFLP